MELCDRSQPKSKCRRHPPLTPKSRENVCRPARTLRVQTERQVVEERQQIRFGAGRWVGSGEWVSKVVELNHRKKSDEVFFPGSRSSPVKGERHASPVKKSKKRNVTSG